MRSEATKIGIGIISTLQMMEHMNRALRAFPSFRPSVQSAECVEDAVLYAKRLALENEVLLVLEAEWLAAVQMAIGGAVPVHGMALTDTDFVRAVYQMRHVLDDGGMISIDVKEQSKLKRWVKELGVNPEQFYMLSSMAERVPQESELQVPLVQECIQEKALDKAVIHAQLYASGVVQGAITMDFAVAKRLQVSGVPHALLVPSESNLVVALERALLSTETRKSKEAQIAVGLIHLDRMDLLFAKLGSEHEVQRMRLDLYRHLLDYVVSLDGSLSHLGGAEYLFFTTRGIFERETQGYKVLGLAPELLRDFGITLSVGIGFGRSANESGTHARQALHVAQSAGGNGCYIVREDGTIVGPLEMTMPLEATLSLADVQVMAAVNEAGMNSVYLSRLIAHVSRTGHLDMDVHELAFILSLTIRSAHRLLVQWMDAGLVGIVGSEKVERGRPKNIYRFSFLQDAVR